MDSENRKPKFILASASPQREKLLLEAGFNFDIIPSKVDESLYPTDSISAQLHTEILAKAKALDVAQNYPSMLVLGSDCVVAIDDEIIGKPNDAAHAQEIVRKLFAKPHKVITGVAFICAEKKIERVFSETTLVYPKKLSESQIAAHIASGQWRGKAGGYGIQDCGDDFVDHIEGSFSNVIGLPIELVAQNLDELLAKK